LLRVGYLPTSIGIYSVRGLERSELGSHEIRPINSALSLGQSIAYSDSMNGWPAFGVWRELLLFVGLYLSVKIVADIKTSSLTKEKHGNCQKLTTMPQSSTQLKNDTVLATKRAYKRISCIPYRLLSSTLSHRGIGRHSDN